MLLANLALLSLIFFNCPLKLPRHAVDGNTWDPALPPFAAAGQHGPVINPGWAPAQKLLELEQQKGSNQIHGSVSGGNEWFHVKFVMIGALVAGLLWRLGFDNSASRSKTNEGGKSGPGETSSPADQTLANIAKSNATCTGLALATAVALMIDSQTRQTDYITKQVGLWMAHYFEPAMLGLSAAPDAITSPHAHGLGPDFLAWEQFLRVPGAMHTDLLHAWLLSAFGNFATWGIFLLYLVLLRRIPAEGEQGPIRRAGFAIVHLLLIAFAVVAHTAPAVFTLVLPWGSEVSGRWAWAWFCAFAIALTALNWRWVGRPTGSA